VGRSIAALGFASFQKYYQRLWAVPRLK